VGRGPSIEGRKSVEDAKRAKVFTKLIREITVAARGGADPAGNARLRLAMDKALTANMPKDTIERAIRRGTGADGGEQTQEIRYEGYGPGGVAVMIDCVTDNPTRTVADVRLAFSKHGGNLGTSGSVAFQFRRIGEIDIAAGGDAAIEDKILDLALSAGADDVQSEGGHCKVIAPPEQFESVRQALIGAGLQPVEAHIIMQPLNRVAVSGATAETLLKLLERLEELDDVQQVHHAAEMPKDLPQPA
jgi:YebC/PmpR family DNA-binding regulatory protein